jgi:S1-C subfamily serine protease
MGVKYQEVDVSGDQTAAQEMVDLTGQMGVPVIVIGHEIIIGFDRQKIQELIASGAAAAPGPESAPKVRFGVKIADAQKIAPQASGVPASGAIIGEVSPGLNGERAGLKSGDIVTQINTRNISGAADMAQALAALKPGDIVTIMFQRGGESRKSEIVV